MQCVDDVDYMLSDAIEISSRIEVGSRTHVESLSLLTDPVLNEVAIPL